MAEPLPLTMMTTENYYELEAAIFSGAQSVSYSHPGGNKSVTYRSMSDMLALLRILAQRLGLEAYGSRRTVVSFSSGYNGRTCNSITEGGECHDSFGVDGRCCP